MAVVSSLVGDVRSYWLRPMATMVGTRSGCRQKRGHHEASCERAGCQLGFQLGREPSRFSSVTHGSSLSARICDICLAAL